MRVMGIDPGMATTGYGIVESIGNKIRVIEYGCITTEADKNTSQRIKIIYNDLKDLILEFKPQSLAVEKLFFNKNVKTAIAVGQARGVAILSGANFGVDVYEYTPLQVKQAVTGYGRADKKQIQHMVKVMLNLENIPKPDDAADALAIAICHLNSSKLYNKIYRNI